MYCSACGRKLEEITRFCPDCGTPQAETHGVTSAQPPSPSAARYSGDITEPKHSPTIRRLRWSILIATVALGMVFLIQNHRQSQLVKSRKAAEAAAETEARAAKSKAEADARRREEERFKALTAAEHLKLAHSILESWKPQSSQDEFTKGFLHLDAIPETAPEYKEAEHLRKTLVAERRKWEQAQAREQLAAQRRLEAERRRRAEMIDGTGIVDNNFTAVDLALYRAAVQAQGYRCDTVSSAVPFVFGGGLTFRYNRHAYSYDIENKGGRLVVTPK